MTVFERWFHDKWRPAIGWLFFVCILCDFVIFPAGYQVAQSIAGVNEFKQWHPITLMGNAMFHISMLTIVGVTAYGRTQEKLKQASTDFKEIQKTLSE